MFILKIEIATHILHFVLWLHVKEKLNAMDFFSKRSYDVKYTEVSLSFVKNSILPRKAQLVN